MISYLEVFLAALPYKADHRAMRRYTRGRHCFDRVEHVVSSILTARTADRNPHQVYVYVSLSLSSLFSSLSHCRCLSTLTHLTQVLPLFLPLTDSQLRPPSVTNLFGRMGTICALAASNC